MAMEKKSDFQLEAPNTTDLFTLQTAAESCRVTRQAFHGWNVTPERVEGTRRLFTLRAILENRLAAARSARSPADADRDRLDARIALLRAQIERERVLADQAASEYAERTEALEVIDAALDKARTIIEALPDALLSEHPKTAPAADLIRRTVGKAIDPLRAGVPSDWSPPMAETD